MAPKRMMAKPGSWNRNYIVGGVAALALVFVLLRLRSGSDPASAEDIRLQANVEASLRQFRERESQARLQRDAHDDDLAQQTAAVLAADEVVQTGTVAGAGTAQQGERAADSTHQTQAQSVVEQLRSEATDVEKRECHTELHADYAAPTVIKWGPRNIQEDAASCCNACIQEPQCNVWSFCDAAEGCSGERAHGECWIKRHPDLDIEKPKADRNADSPWTSGAVYSRSEAEAARAKAAAAAAAEASRLATLHDDTSKPLVYLDIEIAGVRTGRMEFVLFSAEAPRAAENFRALCTCEKGRVPDGHTGAGKQYCFKGNHFYRIIDRFIDQAGAWTDSVYGGQFKDDAKGLTLVHDRKGLLSMANMGPDTNESHFSIMMAPAPHLNGKYTIFGELVSGWEVAEQINALSRGKPNNTATKEAGVLIVGSGQIR